MLWHMIGAGEGFSLIPKLALRNRTEFEDLVCIRSLPEPEARRTIGLVWRASDPRAGAFRELGAFLHGIAPAKD
ncbi:hypothetical protein AA103581_0118 [Gluconobacter wancherniae NBRC 103581]|nr:hypothetical protein AA103581_0118 [Gluconobacter wancherniae NBRC 103581]